MSRKNLKTHSAPRICPECLKTFTLNRVKTVGCYAIVQPGKPRKYCSPECAKKARLRQIAMRPRPSSV